MKIFSTETMVRITQWARSFSSSSRIGRNKITIVLVLATIASGIATYAALTQTPPLGNDPKTIIWLLNLDLVLLLFLVGLVARRIVGLWSGRKRGLAGSHLHVRLVLTFSILAAAPVIIMTVFSAVFFHFGVQTWFSERVRTAVTESQAVAQAYLEEHTQVIRADTLAMANDLNRQASMLLLNEQAFNQIVHTQSVLRNLSEVIVFDSDGRVLSRSGLTFSLEFEQVPPHAIKSADDGEVVVMTAESDDRVRALVKLENFANTYLFVGRMIDPQVLSHLDSTKKATQDYESLEKNYSAMQIAVTLIFVMVGLLLLMAAIGLGLILAGQLVSPISALITTADRVSGGDLSARVSEDKTFQEFDYLAQSFNRMTKQIEEQQGELIEANRQIDRRRHFIETVLAGVSSGVVGLNQLGAVNIINNSALYLLGVKKEEIVGTSLVKIIPDIQQFLDLANSKLAKNIQSEIHFLRNGEKKTLLVRIVFEQIEEENLGVILTFDDITELQSAQRKAAWADVARRIAHEIKNPLTPIQLSAERLKKRYLKQIQDDPQTFVQCTDTIIKHVSDIGRMVNEFSSFARMPEAVLKLENVNQVLRDSLVLYRQAHPYIDITLIDFDEMTFFANIDSGQIGQALSNLVQNAVDSIQGNNEIEKGKIEIILGMHKDQIYVGVFDSGPGFPENVLRSDLTEPYVTHKKKGTGLGLAIVKKIMEDHGGKLILGVPEDFTNAYKKKITVGGASAFLLFPAAHNNIKLSP